jgi:uncharacterized membrane-anchored protein
LTRPLGATLGDTLTKPLAQGGLDLNRISASLAILAAMVVIVVNRNYPRGGGRRTAASSSR